MTETIYLPGLRGNFGDWVYYVCLMQMSELGRRVDYARDIHTNKGLSDMIQRELKHERAPEISEYLIENKERFFNSLVVAVYGGEPSWHEFGRIMPNNKDINIDDIPDYAKHSLGFLRLSGREKLFALDGQHRLSGIKDALGKKSDLGADEVSTIFVAHRHTKLGLRRTRRLFTTLNKTAKSVSKSAVIALDEADVMAITVRRLVEQNPWFYGERIAFKHTNNITAKEVAALTTIGNLYDLLERLFLAGLKGSTRGKAKQRLGFFRPDDAKLDEYYDKACMFFRRLGRAFPEIQSFYDAKDTATIISKNRGAFGGSVLFRPVGLITISEVILSIAARRGDDATFRAAAKLPRDLDKVPYPGVLWDPTKNRVIAAGGPLARRLLLYMLGEPPGVGVARLRADYARALGQSEARVSLPPVLSDGGAANR